MWIEGISFTSLPILLAGSLFEQASLLRLDGYGRSVLEKRRSLVGLGYGKEVGMRLCYVIIKQFMSLI